jgi:hypothetical protein
MSNVPLLFRASLTAIPLFGLLVALGYRFSRFIAAPFHWLTALERGFVCLSLGAGLIQFLPITLAAFGALSVSNLRLAVVCLGLLLLRDASHIARRAYAVARGLRPSPAWRSAAIWLSLLLLFLGVLFVRGLIVTSIADDDGYHLTAPKRWLEACSLTYLPTYTHTNSPMGFEMQYMIALVLGGAAFAKSLHLAAAALCFLAVMLLAKRLGYRCAGMIAVSVMLIENRLFDLPLLMNQVFVDFAVCWMMLGALLLWRIWCERRDDRLLACSALCAGFACSFKFTALSIGAGLLALVVLQLKRDGVPFRAMASSVARALPLIIAPVLPWLLRNGLLTGNPIYPMFSNWIPTRDWSAQQANVFERYFRFYNWEPELPLNELQRKAALLLGAAVVIAALTLAIVRVKSRPLRDLVVFALVLAVGSFATTGLYQRFLLPPLFCIVLIAACLCCDYWRNERWQVLSATLILAIAFLKSGRWLRVGVRDAALVALGLRPEARDDQFWNAYRYVNENTPRGTHVLIGAFCPSFRRTTGVAFWVDRPTYTTDSHLQNYIPMTDFASYLSGIRRAQIDVVVMADSPSTTKSAICSDTAFFANAKNEYPFTRRLAEEYGTLVYKNGHLGVYRLALPKPGTSVGSALARR